MIGLMVVGLTMAVIGLFWLIIAAIRRRQLQHPALVLGVGLLVALLTFTGLGAVVSGDRSQSAAEKTAAEQAASARSSSAAQASSRADAQAAQSASAASASQAAASAQSSSEAAASSQSSASSASAVVGDSSNHKYYPANAVPSDVPADARVNFTDSQTAERAGYTSAE